MPLAPLRCCATPQCPVLVRKGHCPAHTKTERHRPNVDVRKWYRTPAWRVLRADVLHEQPYCWDCTEAGQMVPAQDVHHILKHNGDETLFWDKANLQGLCKRHHSQHTGRGE